MVMCLCAAFPYVVGYKIGEVFPVLPMHLKKSTRWCSKLSWLKNCFLLKMSCEPQLKLDRIQGLTGTDIFEFIIEQKDLKRQERRLKREVLM